VSAILVFGASGVVGQFLLPQLLARGDKLVAISRGAQPDAYRVPNAEWLHGDLCAEMPTLRQVDIVLSLGPLDAFAAWFARAAPTGAHRIVAISSMSAESKRDSVDAAERDLSERLRAAEASLMRSALEHGLDCTIFRPTLIYGTGRDHSLAPIARFAWRLRVLPIPRGANGLRQPVHAADLAAACLAALDNSATYGKVYSLGGGERLRFDEMFARIAAGPPRLALPLPLPLTLLRACAWIARRRIGAGALTRMTEPLIADNSAATRDFGYAPRPFRAQDVLGSADSSISD
jgi:nucleoside-diphosphate-sugar epimerase